MMMSRYNLTLTEEVLAAIRNLEDGTSTIADVQSVLKSVVPLVENDGSTLKDAVRLAEADLEEIQFTKLLDEQVPAAIFRLDKLRGAVQRAEIELHQGTDTER
jgi:hypothetical protein